MGSSDRGAGRPTPRGAIGLSHPLPRDLRSAARPGAAFALVGAITITGLVLPVPSSTPTPATRGAALAVSVALLVQGAVQLRHRTLHEAERDERDTVRSSPPEQATAPTGARVVPARRGAVSPSG